MSTARPQPPHIELTRFAVYRPTGPIVHDVPHVVPHGATQVAGGAARSARRGPGRPPPARRGPARRPAGARAGRLAHDAGLPREPRPRSWRSSARGAGRVARRGRAGVARRRWTGRRLGPWIDGRQGLVTVAVAGRRRRRGGRRGSGRRGPSPTRPACAAGGAGVRAVTVSTKVLRAANDAAVITYPSPRDVVSVAPEQGRQPPHLGVGSTAPSTRTTTAGPWSGTLHDTRHDSRDTTMPGPTTPASRGPSGGDPVTGTRHTTRAGSNW